MPRKRKPRGMKVLEGTLRKDRDQGEPEFSSPSSLDPPDWLSTTDAVEMWGKLVVELGSILTEPDLYALGHLCNQHGEILKQCRAGSRPNAADYTQLRVMCESFGMTPASRAKVGVGATQQKENPFAKLEVAK